MNAADALITPTLLLDEARMSRNIARLAGHLEPLGVPLRPHLKTAKSREIALCQTGGAPGPITVSTLAEAEVFFDAGFSDVLYAVGIARPKLERVKALRARGCDLTVILDSVGQARAVAEVGVPSLIEVDSDGHRGGLRPTGPELVDVGRLLGACLRGVMTHAGESYTASGPEAHAALAETERAAALAAAGALRAAGMACETVSVGSAPTAHAALDLTGVTEVRAGVYVFFDLVMAGIGVCTVDDIALSVLTEVIGHQKAKGWVMIDAGWMALSRDRGTATQAVDQGYGLVCDLDCRVIPDLIVANANQEHGIVALRPSAEAVLPDLPVGTRLRILPNHACATAAQHKAYQVIGGDGIKVWSRFGGW